MRRLICIRMYSLAWTAVHFGAWVMWCTEALLARLDINPGSSLLWSSHKSVNMWEPFGTLPANSTAYWKPAPSERGTFDILSSCILTLLLCAYTCFHPNVPIHEATKWFQRPWAVKLDGILMGLVFPEIVST